MRAGTVTPRPRAAEQRGQALSETLVALIALLPLLLLLIFIGKLASVRQATIAASRAVAFECAARLDDCNAGGAAHLADEARRHLFSATAGPVYAVDPPADELPDDERLHAWNDRRGRALVERMSDVAVSVQPESFDAMRSMVEDRLGGGAGAIGSVIGAASDAVGPGKFGLQLGAGLVTARVQTDVAAREGAADFSKQLDSLGLRLQEKTGILTDAWTASGPIDTDDGRSVYDRVEKGRQLVPWGVMSTLEDTFYTLVAKTFEILRQGQIEGPNLPVRPSQFMNRDTIDLMPADIRDGQGAAGSAGASAQGVPGGPAR